MIKIVIKNKQCIKNICVCLGSFLMFFGHNTAIGSIGKILIYLGMFILLMYILGTTCRNIKLTMNKDKCIFIVLLILLSLGIIVQKDLSVMQKISPLISFFIMLVFYVYGYHLLNDFKIIRLFGYTILVTFIMSMIFTPLLGGEIVTIPTEGMSYALTAGLGHKNASSICIFSAYMAISSYFKFVEKNKADCIAIVLLIIFMLAGASRATWILMLVYTALLNQDVFYKIKKESRFIFYIFLMMFICLCGYVFISMIIMESASYGFRFLGLWSYLNQYGTDANVMLFGHGDILYNSNYGDYDHRIWILLGGIGTFEIAYLDVLAKNGLLGLIVYLYVYFIPIFKGFKSKLKQNKIMFFSLSITALISGMVDIFITQIIYPYAVFVLCTISWVNYNYKNENRLK